MGHLICHVLSEPQFVLVNADFNEEELDACEEIAEGFVIYQPAGDGFPDRYVFHVCLAGELCFSIQKGQLDVCYFFKARMFFAADGVNEVFDFGHEEFADP